MKIQVYGLGSRKECCYQALELYLGTENAIRPFMIGRKLVVQYLGQGREGQRQSVLAEQDCRSLTAYDDWANVIVLMGATLGNRIVGAGSVAANNLPEGGVVIGGSPAKIIRSLSE